MPEHRKGKSGNKKHGRSAKWCQAYRSRGQREKNKAKRLVRHLEKYPNDIKAGEARKRLP